MGDVTPKAVVALTQVSGTSTLTPIAVDSFGTVQVSPPTQNVGGTEEQASLITGIGGLISPPPVYALFGVDLAYGNNPFLNRLEPITTIGNGGDAIPPIEQGNIGVDSWEFAWDGTQFDRVRIASVFKTLIVTASGTTALWVPAGGTSFRIMGYTIDVAGTLAATGVQTIELVDGSTVIRNHLANCIETPTVSISGGADHITCDLGQGLLSINPGNTLNVHLSVAMATGGVAINIWGTEE